MGNTESNNKSSLLKNFQYMIRQDGGGNATLLYFDYLNFLHYELEHEAWKWEIYKTHVNGGVGSGGALSDHDLFCGWKQIQEKIFETLQQRINGKGATTYSWKDDVEPLINIKEKDVLGSPQGCSSINVDINTIDEINNAEFPALTTNKKKNKCDLTIAEGLHIPLRRRGLLVDQMYDYLNEIKDKIKDKDSLKEVLEGKIDAQIHIGNTAVELKKEMIEGISKAISDLIHKKHKDKHESFCNEWERTMEDYHTLLLGNDIVDDNETIKIQCVIKDIESNMGGKDNFQRKWSNYFKELVKELQTKTFTNPNTQKPCTIYPSDKSQCVRFFEEWAEEFCKLKKELGELIVSQCKGDTTNENCTGVCKIYKNLIEVSEPYFKNYKTICADRKYSGTSTTTESELRQSFITAANSSMTDCCTELGDCSPEQLFNVKEDKGNIKYKCLCPEGEYKKEPTKDTDNKCEKYKEPVTVTGHTLPAPPPVTAGHSVDTTTQTPNCDKDDTQCGFGTYINDGKERGKLVGQQNCWGLTYAAANDNNPEKNIKWKNKEDKGCDYLKNSPFDKDPIPPEVYLPPRKQNLCFKDLDDKKFKSTDDLKSQLMKVSVTEGYNLGEYYKEKNSGNNKDKYTYDVEPCSAMKYSFLDLRSIIIGYDMVEQDGTGTENKIKSIFQGGKTNDEAGKPGSPKRQKFWENNETCVWKAMLCGYKSGRDGNGGTPKPSEKDLQNCDKMPDDTTYPIGNDRESGKNFQFLRWAAEWSEDFCTKRKTLAKEVVDKCKACKDASEKYHKKNTIDKSGGTGTGGAPGKKCGDNGKSDPECTDCNKKCDACKQACEAYKNFVSSTGSGTTNKNNWRQQWENMNTRYQYLMGEARSEIEKKQKEAPTSSGTGGTSTTTCNSGSNQCAKSFYEYLYDNGYTTLSSYISKMSQNTECGNDKHVVTTNTCGITYI
ncbi:erythrocyte membrane protein 1 (PfEMP1), truncated, putative [Plasmodium gaboni]|uniref:Erythrocyte membrane protein 1 (PfEMP1), truncated, putative n=1 Tax=Plasmodium gaboni TaxID=647221 RepID=A0ABY0KVZ8_9APIC|nr:erythrocyte membrane protein 1 (PfEMP1), truncated, putative [Plasmodium gaboni]